jgi:nicotinate-nucleotide adenylyltransferase
MKIGLFGGTFDPIHRGHLDVAQAARRSVGLDEVWVVPARVPPHRGVPAASAHHRFAMVALALSGETGLIACDIEMDAPGPSYTVETLDRLGRVLDLSQVFLVTGADAFRDIPSWRGYPALLDLCHFVVVSRPGCGVEMLPRLLPDLAERMMPAGVTPSRIDRPAILLVDAPTAPVSSTDVRRAVEAGAPLAGLVSPAVADYIGRQRLYLSASRIAKEPA